MNPNDIISYYNRGNFKTKSQDYVGAIIDYNKVIEMNPNNYITYRNRSFAKWKFGDQKGSCDDQKKAILLGDKRAARWIETLPGAWCREM